MGNGLRAQNKVSAEAQLHRQLGAVDLTKELAQATAAARAKDTELAHLRAKVARLEAAQRAQRIAGMQASTPPANQAEQEDPVYRWEWLRDDACWQPFSSADSKRLTGHLEAHPHTGGPPVSVVGGTVDLSSLEFLPTGQPSDLARPVCRMAKWDHPWHVWRPPAVVWEFLSYDRWKPFVDADNRELVEQHWKATPEKATFEMVLQCNMHSRTKHLIDFANRTQKNLFTGVERQIRIARPPVTDVLCGNISQQRLYTPERRREKLRKLVEQFRRRPNDAALLLRIALFSYKFDDVELLEGEPAVTHIGILRRVIELAPAWALPYAVLSLSPDAVQLHDGWLLKPEESRAESLRLDPCSGFALAHMESTTTWKAANSKASLLRKLYEFTGGVSHHHASATYAPMGCPREEAVRRCVASLNHMLQQEQLRQAPEMLPRESLIVCQGRNWRFEYSERSSDQSCSPSMLVDLLYETAALLEPTAEVVVGEKRKTRSKSELLAMAKEHPDSAHANRVHLVQGVNAGRPAWYYVLVTGSIGEFMTYLHEEQNVERASLERHGEILSWDYGDGAPSEVTQGIHERFWDDGRHILSDARHLAGFLQAVPDSTLQDAVTALGSISRGEAVGDKLLVLPSTSLLREALDKALELARGVRVDGWPDTQSQSEPWLSMKAAIAIYTLETPYPLYQLINAPLHTPERDRAHLVKHLPYLRLLLRALRELPGKYRHRADQVLYRGVRVGDKAVLKELVTNPGKHFKVGREVTFAAASSTSSKREVALDIGGSGCILFVITGIACAWDISSLSRFRRECEILMEPPTVLVVDGFTQHQTHLEVRVHVKPTSYCYL